MFGMAPSLQRVRCFLIGRFCKSRGWFSRGFLQSAIYGCFLLLASGLFNNKAFADAEKDYQRARSRYYELINSSETGEPTNWQICIEDFLKVAKRYPKHQRAAGAWFSQGLLYWNMNHRFGQRQHLYRAMEAYRVLVDQYPKSNLADDALYNIAVIHHEDLGESKKAVKVLDELLASYRKADMVGQGRKLRAKLSSSVSSTAPTTSTKTTAPAATWATPLEKAAQEKQTLKSTEATGKKQPAKAGRSGSVEIEDIRYWTNPDHTRVSIYLTDEPASYEHRMLRKDPKLNKPYRLYVDISKSKLSKQLRRKLEIADSLLKQVRSGQFKSDVSRVVLDMDSLNDYQISAKQDPHRIVIDVQGDGKGLANSTSKSKSPLVLRGQ